MALILHYFIWQSASHCTHMFSCYGKEGSARCYTSFPWVGIHVFYFNAVLPILRYLFTIFKASAGNTSLRIVSMRHTKHTLCLPYVEVFYVMRGDGKRYGSVVECKWWPYVFSNKYLTLKSIEQRVYLEADNVSIFRTPNWRIKSN